MCIDRKSSIKFAFPPLHDASRTKTLVLAGILCNVVAHRRPLSVWSRRYSRDGGKIIQKYTSKLWWLLEREYRAPSSGDSCAFCMKWEMANDITSITISTENRKNWIADSYVNWDKYLRYFPTLRVSECSGNNLFHGYCGTYFLNVLFKNTLRRNNNFVINAGEAPFRNFNRQQHCNF